ncbi:hypothetical protein WJX73_000456 [Symbiochloris irregularis]|uniref:Probable cytosolic iron-sulfur protein assembly protein CIAO1 homolog n=1 Tax=Symbiochloris irregularis TaxID=706552 RepID=A0AAW1NL98_9CHLO
MARLEQIQELPGHGDRAWSVAWSPTGTTLASCSGDKTVRICFDATTSVWEIQGGVWEQVAVLEGHENEVKAVAWSPLGTHVATCGRDKTVWIWEAEPGHEFECLDVKHGHSQDVKMLAWHPGGQVLVSCSYDDSIKMWVDDGDEWTCQQTLSGGGGGHDSTVWGLAFSGDGWRMVSCSDDLTLRIWSCPVGSGSPRWRLLTTIAGYHERTIFSVDWSRAGSIVTGSGDNSIRIFDEAIVPEGASSEASNSDPASPSSSFRMVVNHADAHSSDVNCVRWHPLDPTLLASASDDGSVKLWRYHPEPSEASLMRAFESYVQPMDSLAKGERHLGNGVDEALPNGANPASGPTNKSQQKAVYP